MLKYLWGCRSQKRNKNPCNSLLRTFVFKSESYKGLLLIYYSKIYVKNAILQNVVSVSVNRIVGSNKTFYFINGLYLTNNDVL